MIDDEVDLPLFTTTFQIGLSHLKQSLYALIGCTKVKVDRMFVSKVKEVFVLCLLTREDPQP